MSLARLLCFMLALALAAPARAQEAPPPYEPDLLRLAELMGALSFLRDLCGAQDGATWRARMEALIEAERPDEARRERLAGAFNRGVADYRRIYRACTPNAQAVIARFLDEGQRLTRDLSGRYGG